MAQTGGRQPQKKTSRPRRSAAQRRGQMLLRVGLLCLAFYGVISLVELQTQIAEKENLKQQLNAQIQQDTDENEALRKQVDEGISDEEIAAIAREQYGYIMPNERVFVDGSRS